MRGLRVSARAVVPRLCSPPFSLTRVSDDSFNVYRACVGNAAGDATQISNFSDGATVIDSIYNPRLSPDGTKILFEALVAGGLTEIWVVSATPGSTATQLIADGSKRLFHPSWHPDSDQFVYVRTQSSSTAGGQIEVDSVSAIGSPATIKAFSSGFSPYRPQFNHDGTLVAYLYTKDLGTPDDFRVMNANGTGDASLDATNVGNYQSTNPQQFGWAHAANKLCYAGSSNAYIINSDGTGRTQINANGPAAGAAMRVTSDCWAPADAFVVVSADLGSGHRAIRCETDGSTTSVLNASHGPDNQNWMRGVYIYNGRIWFIETADGASGGKISSILLDGTDYRVDLDVNPNTILDDIGGGEGFVFDY